MSGSLFDTNFDSKVRLETESTALSENLPFHILVLGDWGGDSEFSQKRMSERRSIEIDRDEFDDVMRKIKPEVRLKFQGDENNYLTLKFESLDDFHPDNIFQQLPLFSDLRNIRQRLKKTDTFDEAAREVHSWYSDLDSNEKKVSQTSEPASTFEAGNLLDQILDETREVDLSKRTTQKTPLSEFIGNIVAPHIVKTDLKEQSKLLAIVDEVVSDIMRKILHHKDFQQLESAWRGLYLLVRRVETDSSLKIFLIQSTKNELSENLSAVSDLAESQLYKWVVNDVIYTEKPWAILCGNYTFGQITEDVGALMRIAKIAELGNCPFISQIKPDIFEINSLEQIADGQKLRISEDSPSFKLWAALRSIPEASYLGLIPTRFIGRFPYGYETDPTETFAFEEIPSQLKHDEYLWINPCFAYILAIAREFQENEWDINQNTALTIDNLPMHMYRLDEVTKTKPCAEIEMTETNYNFILEQGLMTLISLRDSDKIRLSALRSISDKSSLLKGKWS